VDFLKNAFNRGLDIGSLGVKKDINFLGKLAGNHYENGKRVTSKNWNGNDKFVDSANIQKRTVNRQKSNIMSARAEVFGFLNGTVNNNSADPELVNAGRILLENYDILNDNCINDLHRGWTEYINNHDNQQLINEFGKYILEVASSVEREKVFSFLERHKNNNNLRKDILENIHALLHDRDLINKEAISSLYSAITSNNDTAITREITTAASRIKSQIILSFLERHKNNNNLRKDILENIRALLHDRDLIDKEAIGSLYSAITSNNDTAITREITTAASRIKSQRIVSFLEQNKNNNSLDRDILENIHVILQNGNLINKEAISSLYSAITSNNDTAITREITTAASRIKLRIIVSFLKQNKNNNNLRKDILENIHALLHDRDLIDKEAISSLYSAITSNNGAAITQEITTAASRIKPRIVEIKLVKIVPKEDTDIEPSGEAAPPPIKQWGEAAPPPIKQ